MSMKAIYPDEEYPVYSFINPMKGYPSVEVDDDFIALVEAVEELHQKTQDILERMHKRACGSTPEDGFDKCAFCNRPVGDRIPKGWRCACGATWRDDGTWDAP